MASLVTYVGLACSLLLCLGALLAMWSQPSSVGGSDELDERAQGEHQRTE